MGIVNDFGKDIFFTIGVKPSLYSETMRVLNHYASDRARSAYCMLVNGMVWDAEIIVRSFYEAVAKSLFLATAIQERREALLEEYWEVLPAIFDHEGADRAEIAEKLARRHGNKDDERVLAHLRNSTIFNLDRVGNRKFRSEVKQRWSFSGIVSLLSGSNKSHNRIAFIDTLFHGYGMSSHLLHASPKAMDLMEDRVTRGSDLKLLEVSHVTRILSDILHLSAFSFHQVQIATIAKLPLPSVIKESLERFSEIVRPFREEFARSQDGFYGKYES
jgi:hypothetical protein